jgi:L-serine dehydratase
MDCISVFDMLKIGVGPSSSHTLGPWKAALKFVREVEEKNLGPLTDIRVDLYGSLSLTGKGHATDKAVMLGLSGLLPETVEVNNIQNTIDRIQFEKKINFGNYTWVDFDSAINIVFRKEFLSYHANGLKISISSKQGEYQAVYYSIGGGFVLKEGEEAEPVTPLKNFPYPIERASQLLEHCNRGNRKISDIVWMNELTLRSAPEIRKGLDQIWKVMLDSIYQGCHAEGILPGGLKVKRRAFSLHLNMIGEQPYQSQQEWMTLIRKKDIRFREALKWVSAFALAVNEVNAAMGRVVTAPTNGSAGVIPAVLMYYLVIENKAATPEQIRQFLLVASEIGSIFKKGATISAAMGGCQAEIGVSSAMAAAALCELLGGSPGQVMVAAEIAMEHHLGLTCDPVGGLVQVPCIERNTMGAIKAINAAELALETDIRHTKVSLDKVVQTMWETAKDMNAKYKETSEGGLALTVNWVDC